MRQIHIGLFLLLGAYSTAQVSSPEQGVSSSPAASTDSVIHPPGKMTSGQLHAASAENGSVRVIHYLNDSINSSIELLPNNITLLYHYYASGKVRSKCYSTITILTDTLVEFDANFLQVKTISQRFQPIRNGYFIEYREDESTLRDGFYFLGQKQGQWSEYDLKGQIIKTALYVDGQLTPP